MIALETPPDPPLAEPMIIAQSMPKRRPDGFDYVVKDCGQVEHPQKSGWANSLSPALGLSQLLSVDYEVLKPLVKLDQAPKHGKLMRIAYTRREQLPRSQTSWSTVYSNSDGSLPAVPPDTETVKHYKATGEEYDYAAAPGFFGKDKAVFSVEYKGTRYRIDLDIHVYNFIPQASEGIGCVGPRLIVAGGMNP